MQEHGLRAVHRKKFKVTTDSKHNFPVAENLLNRHFTAEKIDEKWATDITYIKTNEGWLYLAVVIDISSRKVVGWSMKPRIQSELTEDALKMAIKARKPPAGLIHHSDRGVQYASGNYQKVLTGAKMICSMSRKGNCWDNAIAESFFSTLKRELIYPLGIFESREQARSKIFKYIETWFNTARKHSAINYQSPVNFELENKNRSLKTAA